MQLGLHDCMSHETSGFRLSYVGKKTEDVDLST